MRAAWRPTGSATESELASSARVSDDIAVLASLWPRSRRCWCWRHRLWRRRCRPHRRARPASTPASTPEASPHVRPADRRMHRPRAARAERRRLGQAHRAADPDRRRARRAEARERKMAEERAALKDAVRARPQPDGALSRTRRRTTRRAKRALDDVRVGDARLAAAHRGARRRAQAADRRGRVLRRHGRCRRSCKQQLDANDAAVAAQRDLLQNQQAEIVRVNALYDAELGAAEEAVGRRAAGLARRLPARRRRRQRRPRRARAIVAPRDESPDFGDS